MSQVFKFDDYRKQKQKLKNNNQYRYSTQQIEEIVRKIYKDKKKDVRTMNLFELGEKEGITILESFFPNPQVVLLIREYHNNKFIYVRKDVKEKEKRFLIAYALGHFFLHKNNSSIMEEISLLNFDINKFSKNQTKVEAIKFAYNLLMPKEVLLKKYRKGKSVFELSEYFNVTEKVTFYRLKEIMK